MKSAKSTKPRDALKLARACIEAKATPGTITVFSKRELAAGCARDVLKKVNVAIAVLLEERKLFRIAHGRTVFYLHAASIASLVRSPAKKKSQSPQPASLAPVFFPAERVRDAYRELTRETGFSDVLISELQRRAGIGFEALAPWLLQESRAGRALPTRGDWSIADSEARASAIQIAGEPHLRVRFAEA